MNDLDLSNLTRRLCDYQHIEMGDARALPLQMYTSSALYEHEQAQIFRREWICVGREDQLPNIGDYFTVELAGEPLVIVRDDDEQLRALSAVCRHRYMSVVSGTGNTRRLVCPYHRWSYGLDGELRGAPLMERPTAEDGGVCRLPQFALETWLGFVFVTLHPTPAPLAPGLTGATNILAPYKFNDWRLAVAYDEIWPGNWKLGMETALEGYHTEGLHPTTVGGLTPPRGCRREAAAEHWNCFRLDINFDHPFGWPLRDIAQAMGGIDAVASPTISLYPNTNISFTPGQCMWLTFLPIGVDRTRAIGALLVCPEEYARLEANAELREQTKLTIDVINSEDASATAQLQRNAHSRFATPGLLNEKEACLLDFYRYLGARLAS